MSQQFNTDSLMRLYIKKRRRRKRVFLALSVLSFFIALGTFRALTLPAVTLAGDPNTMDTAGPTLPEDASADGGVAESPAESPAQTGAPDAGAGAENAADTGAASDSGTGTGTDTGAETGAENASGAENAGEAESAPEATIDDAETPLAPQPSEFTFDDGVGLRVTAVAQNPDSVPLGAELRADRITPENDPGRYLKLQRLIGGEGGLKSSDDFSAYDIYFLLDGQRAEPDGGAVAVTIADTAAPALAPEDAQVFHVLNESTDPSLQKLAALPAGDAAAPAAEASGAASAQGGITFTTESFSAFAVIPSLPAGSPLSYRQVPSDKPVFTSSVYYDAAQPLGIAGHFSLVAFNTLRINADCSGNVLADTLTFGNGRDFGTKNLPPLSEVSYVRNYAKTGDSNGPRSSDQLVLGSGNTVSWTDGGSHFTVNGFKVSQPQSLWQDYDTGGTPFIDLNAVKAEASSLSARLAAMKDQNVKVSLVNTGDQTKSGVTLTSPGGVGVYSTTANNLRDYGYFNVRGLTFNSGGTALTGGTVVINVDFSGWDRSVAFRMPECKIYTANGNSLGLEEIPSFTNGRVLWNFINCGGITVNTQLEYCSILAPGANIVADQNINGTVIADNITINAESHRDDFVGELPKPPASFAVSKVWKDIEGKVLGDADTTGLSVTVELRDGSGRAVGTETLSAANGWTHTWLNLDAGKTYTAVETAVYLNGDTSANLIGQYTSESAASGGGCTITNSPGTLPYTLPETGGTGTHIYTAGGLSLLLLSSALLLRRKAFGADPRKD